MGRWDAGGSGSRCCDFSLIVMNSIDTKIRQRIQKSITVKQALLEDHALLSQIAQLAEDCLNALRQGKGPLLAMEGVCRCPAPRRVHFRFLFDRAPLPSLALERTIPHLVRLATTTALNRSLPE